MAPGKSKIPYRDISLGLQKMREFLLGRKPHNLHARFPPRLAARSQPPPNIPRSPVVKLSGNYYCDRSPFSSAAPPVQAPSPPPAGLPPGGPCDDAPKSRGTRPGRPWGWDDHSYWQC